MDAPRVIKVRQLFPIFHRGRSLLDTTERTFHINGLYPPCSKRAHQSVSAGHKHRKTINAQIQRPQKPLLHQVYAVTVGPATVVVNPASVVVTVTYTVVASGSTGTIVIPAICDVDEDNELVLLAVVATALDGEPVTTVGRSGGLGP